MSTLTHGRFMLIGFFNQREQRKARGADLQRPRGKKGAPLSPISSTTDVDSRFALFISFGTAIIRVLVRLQPVSDL
jgi:hypothetical protein